MSDQTLDCIVIGGGISGVIFLKSAVEKKLKVLLLEKQEGQMAGTSRVARHPDAP